MTDSHGPRLATLDDDGWALLDAEALYAAGERVFWLPSRWEREHLEEHVPAGGYAKLVFRIADPASPRAPATERMWVTLTGREGEHYHGHLANTPHTAGAARVEMPVWFRAEHVIDFAGPEGEGQASEAAGLLQCGEHGTSERCFVCEHLRFDAPPQGFFTADDPEKYRPDAWCRACEALLMEAGGWETIGDRHPKIKLVCGGCYDRLRVQHGRPG